MHLRRWISILDMIFRFLMNLYWVLKLNISTVFYRIYQAVFLRNSYCFTNSLSFRWNFSMIQVGEFSRHMWEYLCKISLQSNMGINRSSCLKSVTLQRYDDFDVVFKWCLNWRVQWAKPMRCTILKCDIQIIWSPRSQAQVYLNVRSYLKPKMMIQAQ